MTLLAILVTFVFPLLPPALGILDDDLAQADSWSLYSWRDDWSVYCECDLQHRQHHGVAVTVEGRRVTVVLPADIDPGGRYLVLVPRYYGGVHEGSGSMLVRLEVPPRAAP